MPAPSDSFIADYLRAESLVSPTALDLALGRRKRGRTGKPAAADPAPLPLALDLVASGTLPLDRYLRALAAHERARARCRACEAERYPARAGARPLPCPSCGDAGAPVSPPDAKPPGPGPEKASEGPLRFEDYEIEAELGRGGMGVVYSALYRPAGRREALKVLLPSATVSPEKIERFRRERSLTARLQHRAIVAIHRAGEHGGLDFLALELVPGGRTLRALVEEGPQPVTRAARIVAEAARGVDAAHRAGVLHRDLKPENILLDDEDRPHVADFGLARALEDVTQLTRSGTMVGTPLYMTLEQMQGRRDLDERVDVYALGCVLHELLAGRHPHEGARTLPELLEHLKRDAPVPLRRVRPEIPAELEALVLATLAGDRDRRPRTAVELAVAIEHAALGQGPRPPAPRPPRRALGPRARVALSAAGAAVLLAVVLWLATRGPSPAVEADAASERTRIARAAQDAVRHAEEIARVEGRGSFQELEAASGALERAAAAQDPAPAAAAPPGDPIAAARRTLASARARALLVSGGDDGPREALAFVQASPEREALAGEQGDALLDLGRSEEALAAFDAAIARRPADASRARLGRAHALERLARETEAREELARVARALGPEAWDAWTALAALDPETRVPPPSLASGEAAPPAAVALARARGRGRTEAFLVASGEAGRAPSGALVHAEALLRLGLPDVAAEVAEASAAAPGRDPLEAALLRAVAGEALVLANRATQAAEPLRQAAQGFDRPLPGTNDPLERRRAARAGKARALVALGDALRSKGDQEGARERYDLAARACPSSAAPHARLAELFLARHDPDHAVGEAWAALDADRRSAAALSALVDASPGAARSDPRVLAALDRALASPANGPASCEDRSDLLLARARAVPGSAALPYFEEAASLDRRDPFVAAAWTHVALARLLTDYARGTVARGLAEARLLARPRSAAALAAAAQACLAANDANEAGRLARLALNLNPALGEGHLAVADQLAAKLSLADAVAEYGAAERGGARPIDVELGIGFTLVRAGRASDAVAWFDRAIVREPFWAPLYGGRAAALRELGRQEESDADRDRQASFTNQPDAEWTAALERARSEEAARPEVAAALDEELLRTRPGRGDVWFRRGAIAISTHASVLGLALVGRAVYGVPRLETDLGAELLRPAVRADPGLAAALAAGIPDRPDLAGEAAFVAGALELARASAADPDEAATCAARALLDLERAVQERPGFHAARVLRGLARSLVGAPRAGLADARISFDATETLGDPSRVLLGVVLARAGDPVAASAELRRAFAASPAARRRSELAFLPEPLRSAREPR